MITITGLWLNTSKKGDNYMAGYFGNARCFVFKNDKTDNDKAPQYRLVIADPPKKEDEESKKEEGPGHDIPF